MAAQRRSTVHASEQHLSRAQLRSRSVLATLMRRNARPLTWFTLLSIANEAIHMAVPIALGYVIDTGILAGDLTFTIWATLAIVASRLLAMWLWAVSFYGLMELRVAEQHRLRLAVTAAALDPSTPPIDRPAGEVLSISTSDADRAPDVFEMIGWAVSASLAILGAGIWLLWMNVWVGLAVFAGLAAQVLALRIITPILSQKYDRQQSFTADAASTATDLVQGLRVLQGLGVQSRARSAYRARSRAALQAALINARYSGISTGIMTLISTIMIASVIVIAGTLSLEKSISVGTFIAMAAVVRNMSGMLQGLSGVPVWFASFATSARRVRHLLSEMGHPLHSPVVHAAIEANPVTTPPASHTEAYEPTSAHHGRRLPAPEHISTPTLGTITRGQVLAVVPVTAQDALDVLAELSALDLVRGQLLIEPHAVDLFDGTLRDQLATGRSAEHVPPDDDTWALNALEAAGASDLLGILADGMDERIIDRGANLSGGQRQRLALARALAADPPILALHDPTTAVDAVTEQKIARSLIAHREGPRITVIVTKAPALLHHAHRVLCVESGRVIAEGTHRELLSHRAYAEVVQR